MRNESERERGRDPYIEGKKVGEREVLVDPARQVPAVRSSPSVWRDMRPLGDVTMRGRRPFASPRGRRHWVGCRARVGANSCLQRAEGVRSPYHAVDGGLVMVDEPWAGYRRGLEKVGVVPAKLIV